MPTSPRKIEAAGFTLMEMLVVLTIIAIVAAIAVSRLPTVPGAGQRIRLAALARQTLQTGRIRAMAEGHDVTIEAAALAANATGLSIKGPTGGNRLIFFPDGSASGGEVMLGAAPLLKVDWLTGSVADAG